MKNIFNFINRKFKKIRTKKDHLAVIQHAKERYEWLENQGKAGNTGYIMYVYNVDTGRLHWQIHDRKAIDTNTPKEP